jgi:hypothetical protein
VANAALVATRSTAEIAEAATLSADIAKRSLETAQATDVSVVGIASSDETCIRTGSVIGVIVKNHGRTRADAVTINISFSVDEKTMAVPAPPPFALPADAVQSIQVEQAVRWLAADDFRKIETGASQLSILVEIQYTDLFHANRSAKAPGLFVVGRGFAIAGNQPVMAKPAVSSEYNRPT